MMDPATPPRSRCSQTMEDEHSNMAQLPKKMLFPPATPKKGNELTAPVTPSTVQKHVVSHQLHKQQQKQQLNFKNGPFLQLPSQQRQQSAINSPFNGLKSPEYTPMRRSSITNSNALKNNNLKNVSRVLFPTDGIDEDDVSNIVLLPPSTPTKSSHRIESRREQEAGTPADKIITFDLSKEWNNKDYSIDNRDDMDSAELITKAKMVNPFMSTEVPSKETRVLRKMDLLQENPDIESHITYVNRNGEKVKQRRLSRDAQRLRPKMLFEDQLYSDTKSDLDIDLESE